MSTDVHGVTANGRLYCCDCGKFMKLKDSECVQTAESWKFEPEWSYIHARGKGCKA